MSNTAQINVNVNDFVVNAAYPASGAPPGPYCGIDQMTIANGPGGSGPLNASGQVVLNGGTISVTRNNTGNNPIRIVFNITAAGATYNPTSVVFVQQGLNPGDPSGSQNFTDHTPTNQTISVNNQWTLHKSNAGNQTPAWKFYIRINVPGTMTFGWIDPVIENEN